MNNLYEITFIKCDRKCYYYCETVDESRKFIEYIKKDGAINITFRKFC